VAAGERQGLRNRRVDLAEVPDELARLCPDPTERLLVTLERLRAGEVREPERIASFVLGMSRMTVLEIRRGARRREELLQAYGDTPEAVEAPEPLALDADKLAECLQALAERERSVVSLTFLAEKPAEEVAAALGLTAGNVRVIRHRALGRLRECMDEAA
jgi:RNA polymerase sigma-70 factor (ECF subfamily)